MVSKVCTVYTSLPMTCEFLFIATIFILIFIEVPLLNVGVFFFTLLNSFLLWNSLKMGESY